MTTRSQKAALAEREKRARKATMEWKWHAEHWDLMCFVPSHIREIDKLIQEYNLETELLLPILQKYYSSLIEMKGYESAAFIAKKYNL